MDEKHFQTIIAAIALGFTVLSCLLVVPPLIENPRAAERQVHRAGPAQEDLS